MALKRVAAVSDLSCLGKCSLTVALPILSAAGIEASPIPTAVLSTHTGGFGENTLRDLSEDILPIARHWKREGVALDAIYTGYLCSERQADLVLQAVGTLCGRDTLVVTDPAMADHGRLYRGLPANFPSAMLRLCRAADIITPNLTEAAMLVGDSLPEEGYNTEQTEELVMRLYEQTGAAVVLTGVSPSEDKIGAAVFDGNAVSYVFSEKQDRIAHGTGDIFASVLTAALLNGQRLTAAAQIAADFTGECIKVTPPGKEQERYGLHFESQLPKLAAYFQP